MRNSYVRKFQFGAVAQSGGKAQQKESTNDPQSLAFPKYYLLFSGILKLAEESEEFRVRNKVSQIFRRAILLWVSNEFRHNDGMTTPWLNSIYWSLLEQIKKQLKERVDNQSDRHDGEQYMVAMQNILALSIRDNAYIGIVSILSNFGQSGINISNENLLKWVPPQKSMTNDELTKYLGDIQEKGSNLPLGMIKDACQEFRKKHDKKVNFENVRRLYTEILTELYSGDYAQGYIGNLPSNKVLNRYINTRMLMDIFNFRFQAEFQDYKGVKPSNPPWMAWITSINNIMVEDTLPLEMVYIAISYDGLLEDFAKSAYLFRVL